MSSRQYKVMQTTAYNGSLVITFSGAVTMSGWWFETVKGPPGRDAVRFRLERSMGPNSGFETWDQVGHPFTMSSVHAHMHASAHARALVRTRALKRSFRISL